MSRYEKCELDPVLSLMNLLSIVVNYFSLLDDCDIPTEKINQGCSFLMTLLLLTEGLDQKTIKESMSPMRTTFFQLEFRTAMVCCRQNVSKYLFLFFSSD